MAVVARGAVAGQAFARTVFAIAKRQFTGTLTLTEHGRQYLVGWRDGLVVAARSTSPADSVARVALTANLVTSTQLGEIMRQHAGADDAEILRAVVAAGRLSDSHQTALVRRVLLQQAMRIFALPEADFQLDDHSELPEPEGVPPLSVRTLIYRGLFSHYDADRLNAEMAAVAGARFQLTATDADARARLAHYGFSETGVACVKLLAHAPMTLDALAAKLPQANARELAIVVYALLSADDVNARRARGPRPAVPTPTPTASPARAVRASRQSAPPRSRRARSESLSGARSGGVPQAPMRDTDSRSIKLPPQVIQRAKRAVTSPGLNVEIRALIDSKLAELDGDCDHFELLGVTRSADPQAIRKAYFGLAKKLHPDRLRALGIADEARSAQRLFATINQAFAVLRDAGKREQYIASLERGGTGDSARDQVQAEARAMELLSAEEHFLRGERALRGNQFASALSEFRHAVELNAEEPEHHALLAWAIWCNAADKPAALGEVRTMLQHAMRLSERCVPAYFYQGQIASAMGQQQAALEHFRKVLQLQPSHREAELQVRLIGNRMAKKDTSRRGKRKP